MKNRNIIIHITIICLCVALLTLLCACKNNTSEKVTEGTESGNKETQNEKSDDKDSGRMIFFGLRSQPDRKDLPSVYDFAAIKTDETSPEELVKAVGNPQKQFIRKSDNGLFYCEYKTAEGYSVILEFADSASLHANISFEEFKKELYSSPDFKEYQSPLHGLDYASFKYSVLQAQNEYFDEKECFVHAVTVSRTEQNKIKKYKFITESGKVTLAEISE